MSEFRATVWDFYHIHKRNLPWREPEYGGKFDPYKIMVSEIMLQQTQATRVVPKYKLFINKFPTVRTLQQAQLSDVLRAWMGLGYNRRAKFLHVAADYIMRDYSGRIPDQVAQLTSLPGIGPNTAGAIAAYAFNKPEVFIETNIRTVYIKHFFTLGSEVHDKQIIPLVHESLDTKRPRDWYWAIMDYGSWLKATDGNYSRYSRHHTAQSAFEGSFRQLRAKILKTVLENPTLHDEIMLNMRDSRTKRAIDSLVQDELITLQCGKLKIR